MAGLYIMFNCLHMRLRSFSWAIYIYEIEFGVNGGPMYKGVISELGLGL